MGGCGGLVLVLVRVRFVGSHYIPPGLIKPQRNRVAMRTSTRPPPIPASAPCPYSWEQLLLPDPLFAALVFEGKLELHTVGQRLARLDVDILLNYARDSQVSQGLRGSLDGGSRRLLP